MEHICPYCNGLASIDLLCPACGLPMNDCGTLQETLGPYAPYEENSLVHAQYDCVHQLYCRNCDVEYYYTIPN